MYYSFPDQYPKKPNANFLSRHYTFLIFPMAIFNSVPRHILHMYLRTSWSAVTVNEVLWEGQERVTDNSPVHLLRYRLLPKHQRFKKRYSNIRCSNYHNTGIDGNLKKNTKRRSALNCVLLKSLTLFSCRKVEKFQAKCWKANGTILKKRPEVLKLRYWMQEWFSFFLRASRFNAVGLCCSSR